ncbi:uridine kinase family protein [Flavobacterium soyangense]|uniref:Phosphoribulokinase/uridine kinase domain-containing protein n=1 Tax=Flavobacterium soyangense TaxID=2023265 RepID=A0A930UAZ0_9FLAO|nr:hypothetical protein [Flavobacterium soyangense]MBF2709896.1 hypothetical protein [Flavobacterium soyangense]
MKNINVFNTVLNEILTIKNKRNVVFVALCGAADTGKSTLAEKICVELNNQQVRSECISTDSFLIDRKDRNIKRISGYNTDSLKCCVLLNVVEKIEQKKEVKYYPYDNKSGKNVSGYRLINAPNVLIIEGIHSLNDIIRNKIDLKIYIDAESEVLKKLRYNANINKRGFSEKEAGKKIDNEMEEYTKYILPNKKYSDLIINSTEKYNYKIK